MQGFWFAADDNVFDTFIELWALAIVRNQESAPAA
jgi:hypothetical protein